MTKRELEENTRSTRNVAIGTFLLSIICGICSHYMREDADLGRAAGVLFMLVFTGLCYEWLRLKRHLDEVRELTPNEDVTLPPLSRAVRDAVTRRKA